MKLPELFGPKTIVSTGQDFRAHILPLAMTRTPGRADKPPYTMTREGDNAEITLYGEIVESRPVDLWTGEPVQGDFIIQSEFMTDLETIADIKSLTIRMNSIGGDAGVSILIHNRLRELAEHGTELTCIVDGVAMSGGSLIMCACDRVSVNPSSLVMIHKCWAFLFGGYNADELRQEASARDAWDKAQIAIYRRKTGLSERTLSNMMAHTTYMTGKEAVEKGFADTLLEDTEPLRITASADRRSLFVRGRRIQLPIGMHSPDRIPVIDAGTEVPEETNIEEPDKTGGQIGGTTMAKTLEELRAENPELADQFMVEARAALSLSGSTKTPETEDPAADERRRLREIDEVASFCDPETVREAKYGENACSASEMLMRAAQKARQQGLKFLANLEADTSASGAQNVTADPDGNENATGGGNTPLEVMTAAKNAATRYLTMKEGKRHEQ